MNIFVLGTVWNNAKSAVQTNLYAIYVARVNPGRPPQPFDFPCLIVGTLPRRRIHKLHYLLCASFLFSPWAPPVMCC